jgi:methionyl-tRNA formyltransferase
MSRLRVFISGQKYFGERVLRLCEKHGFEIAGVCCPLTDGYIYPAAVARGIPIIPSGSLRRESMPDAVDLGICAHSFDYVGRGARYAARLGWLGYHPSLLPRHRGRSAIEWALRFNDPITGGSLYWLNDGIDRGDIESQEWIWLDRSKTASEIWRGELLPLGLRLFDEAFARIKAGEIRRKPQDPRFSTFEPSLDSVRDLYKPDLLLLPGA